MLGTPLILYVGILYVLFSPPSASRGTSFPAPLGCVDSKPSFSHLAGSTNQCSPPYSEMPSVLQGIPWPILRGPLRSHFWKKKKEVAPAVLRGRMPWPSNAGLLGKKARITQKLGDFFSAEPLKSLERNGKRTKKQEKAGKTKNSKRKTRKARELRRVRVRVRYNPLDRCEHMSATAWAQTLSVRFSFRNNPEGPAI